MRWKGITKNYAMKVAATFWLLTFASATDKPAKKSKVEVLTDNTSWCWFQDNRAIIDGDQLLVTGVTSEGANIVTSYNMATGERKTVIMNDQTFKADDHNAGVLLRRPDGKYLSVYAGHGDESKMRYRISTAPGDISTWDKERSAETGGKTSYSNVYMLAKSGKTYNFHRGIDQDPNYMVSEDDGNTWRYGGQVFAFKGRPYVRYASNNKDRVHFITTEEHPRHYNNSIYYGYIENDQLFKSGDKLVGALSQKPGTNLSPKDFTRVYDGDSTTRTNVAWTSDIKLDKQGFPYIAFSVTKDPIALGETKNTEVGGSDNRYHYARWDGKKWFEYEIAYAGTRLYAGENEYTGLITLHPTNPDVVYISANVNPETGKPLVKGKQHYEIFRGVTKNKGASWTWTAVTKNSKSDNIRPIVVSSDKYDAVLWLNGTYTTYKIYDLKALAIVTKK